MLDLQQSHGMEHALSAYYDITHGEGLAILTPRWMKHILSDRTVDRFVKYGVNVFGLIKALINMRSRTRRSKRPISSLNPSAFLCI